MKYEIRDRLFSYGYLAKVMKTFLVNALFNTARFYVIIQTVYQYDLLSADYKHIVIINQINLTRF